MNDVKGLNLKIGSKVRNDSYVAVIKTFQLRSGDRSSFLSHEKSET